MTNPFDKLIKETQDKYRLSWEKSLEKHKKFCKWQDDDFKWAIKHGYFLPKLIIEKTIVEAKPRKLNTKYSLEVLPDKVYHSEDAFKGLLFIINNQEEENSKNGNYIIMHPDVYKAIEKYKNQNAIQMFFWNIKWRFINCSINFENWKGYMRGEDWDFWEILNGEWSSYD